MVRPVLFMGISLLAVSSCGGLAWAQIVTDGTVGPVASLSGAAVEIGADLGTVQGTNLFHSFEDFNIANGQTVTFTGPQTLANLLSRVTGGRVSTIDGVLRSEVGQADLWFLNPAGVVFGPGASIDVPASFHVSTADEVRFSDGTVFSASDPAASTLSVAGPEAFGLLDATPGSLTVTDAALEVTVGRTLSVAAGELQVSGSGLTAPGGRIDLVTARGPTAVTVGTGATDAPPAGTIALTGSRIVSSGAGGGTVLMKTGRLEVSATQVTSANQSDTPGGGGIFVEADDFSLASQSQIVTLATNGGTAGPVRIDIAGSFEILDGGIIGSATTSSGAGGAVTIEAGRLTIDGMGGGGTAIASETSANSTGAGGDISISVVDDLHVRAGGLIASYTRGEGDSGSVEITTGSLFLTKSGTSAKTAIESATVAGSSGSAGRISIAAVQDIMIAGGGQIGSVTVAEGDTGSVELSAETLLIDGEDVGAFTGLGNQASEASTGAVGTVHVVVSDQISILGGGRITSNTRSIGDAGSVTVQAGTLRIDRNGSASGTGIDTDAGSASTGSAGDIIVNVDGAIELVNGGTIKSNTFSIGDAGTITVDAKSLLLDGTGTRSLTAISSDANPGSAGAAGRVSVAVEDSLMLVNGGQIISNTLGEGDGGRIEVAAGDLLINGNNGDLFTGIATQATRANAGAAGSILVTVDGQTTILGGGQISSSTFAAGGAGVVEVVSGDLLIDPTGSRFMTGVVSSALDGSTGPSGRVSVTARDLVEVRNGGGITSDSFSVGDAGAVAVTAATVRVSNGAAISSGVARTGTGAGGTVSVTGSSSVEVSTNGTIQSKNVGPKPGGQVTVTAPVVRLSSGGAITAESSGTGASGGILVVAPQSLILDEGRVTTEAAQAGGGGIELRVGHLIDLQDSQVTTEVQGLTGDAGDIDIDPRFLVLQNGLIRANAIGGNGGNISIVAGTLFSDRDSVIEATSALGVSGEISISSPETDVSGGLVTLATDFLDVGSGLTDRCAAAAAGRASSLARVGRGGVPAAPEVPLPSYLIARDNVMDSGPAPVARAPVGDRITHPAPVRVAMRCGG